VAGAGIARQSRETRCRNCRRRRLWRAELQDWAYLDAVAEVWWQLSLAKAHQIREDLVLALFEGQPDGGCSVAICRMDCVRVRLFCLRVTNTEIFGQKGELRKHGMLESWQRGFAVRHGCGS
jgi:hypothetical protein